MAKTFGIKLTSYVEVEAEDSMGAFGILMEECLAAQDRQAEQDETTIATDVLANATFKGTDVSEVDN